MSCLAGGWRLYCLLSIIPSTAELLFIQSGSRQSCIRQSVFPVIFNFSARPLRVAAEALRYDTSLGLWEVDACWDNIGNDGLIMLMMTIQT
ncbi:hypothetical protein EV424DRAFT_1374805 [Suillus variegatus]|nr:hypothetical protein EV424DRAFT_1374805 [Suillus variegatus]